MKKWSKVLAVSMIATTVLSACSNTSNNSKKESQGEATKAPAVESEKVVELKFTVWGDISSAGPEVALTEEFNKNHKNIHVTFEPVPGDGYGTKLTTSLAAGQAPDVFLIGEGDYFTYVNKGVVEPIDSFLEADSSFDTAIFEKNLLDMGRINGKLYYLPKDFNPLSLWYNKKMFDDAGMEYPKDDWTWEDLNKAAEKLTEKDKNGKYSKYGFNATKWAYPVFTYLWSNGADISNEDGTKADGFMNSDKTIAAMEKYVEMSIGKDKVSPTPQDAETLGGDGSMFMTDKLAMMITGRWTKYDLDRSNINYGTSMIPTGADGQRAGITAAAGWAINANGKHKEEAYELVKWLSGKEAQEIRSEKGLVLPATIEQLDEVKKTEVADQPIIKMMDYSKKPVNMISADGPIFIDEFNKAMEKILLGKSSVRDALNEAAKAVDSQITK